MKDVQHIFYFIIFLLSVRMLHARACDRCPCFKRTQKIDKIHNSTAHSYVLNTLDTKDYEYKFRVALIYDNDDVYDFFVKAIMKNKPDHQKDIVLSNKIFSLENHPYISYQLTLVPITLDEFKNNQDNVLSQYGGLIYLFNIKNKKDLDAANFTLVSLHNCVGSPLNEEDPDCSKLAYGIFLILDKNYDKKTGIDPYSPKLRVRFPDGSFTKTVVDNDLKKSNVAITTSTLQAFIGILIRKTSNNKGNC